jgi:uncharacterized protein
MKLHDSLQRRMVTCEAVIAETLHKLHSVFGAADAILSNVEHNFLELPFALATSAAGVRSLLTKYQDIPADFADACLIAMADQLNTGDILTLDSDFKHYRWRRNRRFNLLVPMN